MKKREKLAQRGRGLLFKFWDPLIPHLFGTAEVTNVKFCMQTDRN